MALPLHKGGAITHTNNYRGISVTSSLGKLLSSVLSNRLYQEIESKKGKRTSDHLFVLKALIEDYKARKRPIYACYVDFKKAYDTVWRNGLDSRFKIQDFIHNLHSVNNCFGRGDIYSM